MLGLHLLWLIWLVPSPILFRTPSQTPQRIRFLTRAADANGHGGDPNGDARILWSPILLSLPTPMGFSGAVVSDELVVQPSLVAPPAQPRYLERTDYRPPLPVVAARVPAAREGRGGRPGAGSSGRPRPGPEPGLRITTSPAGGGPRLVHIPWPEDSAGMVTSTSWKITARLEVEPGGAVSAAFLETTAPSQTVNRLAARMLRQWRADADSTGGVARVAVRYVARAAPGAAGEEDGP
jgi:hypothetical protein